MCDIDKDFKRHKYDNLQVSVLDLFLKCYFLGILQYFQLNNNIECYLLIVIYLLTYLKSVINMNFSILLNGRCGKRAIYPNAIYTYIMRGCCIIRDTT